LVASKIFFCFFFKKRNILLTVSLLHFLGRLLCLLTDVISNFVRFLFLFFFYFFSLLTTFSSLLGFSVLEFLLETLWLCGSWTEFRGIHFEVIFFVFFNETFTNVRLFLFVGLDSILKVNFKVFFFICFQHHQLRL